VMSATLPVDEFAPITVAGVIPARSANTEKANVLRFPALPLICQSRPAENCLESQ
jgi:hypothetical protein